MIYEEDYLNRITIDPQVCEGKPTIRGLRYPLEMLVNLLSSGKDEEEILETYEELEAEDLALCRWLAEQN